MEIGNSQFLLLSMEKTHLESSNNCSTESCLKINVCNLLFEKLFSKFFRKKAMKSCLTILTSVGVNVKYVFLLHGGTNLH